MEWPLDAVNAADVKLLTVSELDRAMEVVVMFSEVVKLAGDKLAYRMPLPGQEDCTPSYLLATFSLAASAWCWRPQC